jgi:hypothetical protein
LLVDVEPELLLEGLHKCILYFQKTNYWKKFKFSAGRYLVLIDATEAHRSQKVNRQQYPTLKEFFPVLLESLLLFTSPRQI